MLFLMMCTFVPVQDNAVRSGAATVGFTPSTRQHVVLSAILERRIVVPGVSTRRVVGVNPFALFFQATQFMTVCLMPVLLLPTLKPLPFPPAPVHN